MGKLSLFIFAFFATHFFVHLLIPLAPRFGLIDVPRGHKRHDGNIPVVGGLAMFMGLTLTWMIFPKLEHVSLPLPEAAVLCSGLLALVGIIDDRRGVPVAIRFGAQILAALGMIFLGGVMLHDLGYLLSGSLIELTALAVPFTVFATMGTINAMNLIDGMDGLAGGLAMVVLSLLAVASALADRSGPVLTSIAMMGALAGFLIFNLRWRQRDRAVVFLGDAGSTFLGFLLTWLLISLSQGSDRAIAPVTALWLFAVPLYDTIGAMLRRALRGSSPFTADRLHIHHLMSDAGFDVRVTVGLLLALQLVMGTIGLAGLYLELKDATMFYAFGALFGLYFLAIFEPMRTVRFLAKLRKSLWWERGEPVELFVSGLSEPSIERVLNRLGRSHAYTGISLWTVCNSDKRQHYHAVITVRSGDAIRRLRKDLLRQRCSAPDLIVRCYVRRNGDRRSEDGLFKPWSHGERRVLERRSAVKHCIARIGDSQAPLPYGKWNELIAPQNNN